MSKVYEAHEEEQKKALEFAEKERDYVPEPGRTDAENAAMFPDRVISPNPITDNRD